MPSKMLGVLRPSVYRCKLGGFELTTILDGVTQRDGPYPLFGPNATAEEVQGLAVANRLPPELLEHPYVPCVLNTGKELILSTRQWRRATWRRRRQSPRASVGCRLCARGYRHRRPHPRPPRSHCRAGRRRQIGVPQCPLRLLPSLAILMVSHATILSTPSSGSTLERKEEDSKPVEHSLSVGVAPFKTTDDELSIFFVVVGIVIDLLLLWYTREYREKTFSNIVLRSEEVSPHSRALNATGPKACAEGILWKRSMSGSSCLSSDPPR